jgi:hypothetical protein
MSNIWWDDLWAGPVGSFVFFLLLFFSFPSTLRCHFASLLLRGHLAYVSEKD